MPTPLQTKPLRGPASAVAKALAATQPITHMWRDGLTVIAIASGLPDRKPEYLTFDEATTGGAVEVHEAAVQSVPTVEASVGPSPVLILGGDTIIGGGQNRIINITVLLKAAATTAIPVSCLEMHRWDRGGQFRSSRPVDHMLRRMVVEQVSPDHQFAADQGAVWQEIGQRQARASMASPTQALHDVYALEEDSVEEFVGAFPMPAGSRGVAIGLYDRLVGLDLFDSAETLERQWPRLVASAASALLDQQRSIAAGVASKPKHRHLDSGALDRMLARATSALTDASATPSVGLGTDVRFSGSTVVGTGLVHDRRAIHVALFRPG